jgi:hypothetical protein
MPYKEKAKQKEANRLARQQERTELKTLRSQVAKIKETLKSPPSISSVQVRAIIDKIVNPDPPAPQESITKPQQEPSAAPTETQAPEVAVSPEIPQEMVTLNPEPTTETELSPYWRHQRELTAQTKQKEQCNP